jgi:hypothetical protein
MEAGKFVNEKLATSVPWDDLVQQSNLQKLLLAIVQRLDRYDRTLAPGSDVPLSVIPSDELQQYRERIDILENLALQSRVDAIKKEGDSLTSVASDAKKRLSLAKHVIPLLQLKAKVDSFDIALQTNAQQIDDTNSTLAKLATAFDKQIRECQAEVKVGGSPAFFR